MNRKTWSWIAAALSGAGIATAANTIIIKSAPPEQAAPATADSRLNPTEAYQKFIEQMVTPENLSDLVAKMDTVVDQADNADPALAGQNVAEAETRNGFRLQLSVIHSPEAILYLAGISRKNEEMLKVQEATMLFALFCDRIGLTHPIHVSEGEKPIFHAQWLIKPTEWKVMRKKVLEVRAATRSEKNLFTVMRNAVTQEVSARVAAKQAETAKTR